ncbi:MAG: autotransporter domain-containing protein [Candidatus Omnitrophota bacterium]
MAKYRKILNALFICVVLSFLLDSSAPVAAETYNESVASAKAHAESPAAIWLPENSPGGSIITIVGGGQASENADYGIRYDDTDTKVIARTMAKQKFWIDGSSTTKAPGEDYNIVGTIASGTGAFVTVGNDMTRFLDNNKGTLTGSDVIKLIERGLGINNDGTHDAIIEYAVGPAAGGYLNDNLIRPTKNVDMSVYDTADPAVFTDGGPFLAKPANMLAGTYSDFQTFFTNFRNNAYNLAGSPFPFTQFGYTYFWDNGGLTLSQIQGMTEFVILPNQDFSGTVLGNPYGTVTVYGIYPTQSYIYTRNDGADFSYGAGSEYGNGFASFDITGSCDTVWAGHRFQSKIKTDLINNNKIKIESGGSVSGGQGILVWSLNYEVENSGTVTGSTSKKWGQAGTEDIAILFKGDTTVYSLSVPVPASGANTVTNYGEISSSATGTAIKIENGDTVINNYAGAKIRGLTAIDGSLSTGTVSIYNRGTISGNIALAAAAPTSFDIGNSALTVTNGYISNLDLTANSATDFGSITATGSFFNAASDVGVTVGGYIPNNTTFKVVDAAGSGVGAVPGTITSTSPIFNLSGSDATGDLVLTATRVNNYNSFAANPNAAQAGAVLNAIADSGTASGDMVTVLGALDSIPSASGINSALESMLPDVDNSSPQVTQAVLGQYLSTVFAHLDAYKNVTSSAKQGADVWGSGFGGYIHQGPRASSNGYNANIWGTALGCDILAGEHLRLGLSAGFARNFVRTKDSSGRTDIDSYQGAIYGSYAEDAYFIDAALPFACNTYDTSRHIAVGALDRIAEGKYNGQQYSGYIGGGYKFSGKKIDLTPLASFQYTHLRLNSYTESGAGAASLHIDPQDYNVAQTGVGIKIGYPVALKRGFGTLTPELKFKWLYDWIGDAQQATSTFTGGGGSFSTEGFTPARSSFDFGAKLALETADFVTLSFSYDLELKEDLYGHYALLELRYRF